jgi:hypothetical protein
LLGELFIYFVRGLCSYLACFCHEGGVSVYLGHLKNLLAYAGRSPLGLARMQASKQGRKEASFQARKEIKEIKKERKERKKQVRKGASGLYLLFICFVR